MWKEYSIIAASLVGINNVLYKYALGLKKEEYVLYGCFISIGLGIIGAMYLTLTNKIHLIKTISPKRLMVMGIISLFFFSGIIIYYSSLPISPNISLNAALFAGSKIITVLLITCLVFKETLSLKQIASLLLILSGIFIFGLK